MFKINFYSHSLLLLSFTFLFYSLSASNDSLLVFLHEELQREMKELKTEDEPPYYMSFRVDDITQTQITAAFGNLMANNDTRTRIFTPQVRIGDYSFDNTHEFEEGFSMFEDDYMDPGYAQLPLENKPLAVKHSMWLSVDNAYKAALRKYQSNTSRRATSTKKANVHDFSREDPVVYFEPPYNEEDIKMDEATVIQKLKDYSQQLSKDSSILNANITLRYLKNRKYFVSTEGSSVVQNSMLSQILVVAMVKNKSGNVIPQTISLIGKHPGELLSDQETSNQISNLAQLTRKLQNAPAAEPYAGPAILSPEASGVFFHEIFGHRIEGHRLEKKSDGQTFTDKVGQKVLPTSFSVISDPTIATFQDIELIGFYLYDDEGIKSQKVTVVEDGVLKEFLMSRKPLSTHSRSNGHGRASAGSKPVSRQSNLIITADKTYSNKELRKRLISECKKQKKEYGYYFKSVIGGFTITDRYNPNVFNIIPSEVYRVYVDGRPDELVVGVELIGTPLTMFSNIEYAGEDMGYFSGFCGAESGYIPVSAVSPSIFVKKIETQKGMEMKYEMPLLPPPSTNKQEKSINK